MGRRRHLLADQALWIRLPGYQTISRQPLTDFWAADLNPEDFCGLAKSYAAQCYFLRLCKSHIVRQTPKSLLHNFTASQLQSTSLDCKVCGVFNDSEHAQLPSAFEAAAYRAVFGLPAQCGITVNQVLIDHRLLKVDSPVDIYLCCIKLCIMVDGQGHFRDHMETTAAKQAKIDLNFNKQALKHGHKVLRLHHQDVGLYPQIVRLVVSRYKNAVCRSGRKPIEFSKSYDRSVRKYWGLPLLN